MSEFDPALINGIALAYAGDAIYEVHIRDYLLHQGITKPGQLQKNAVRFVSAKAQANIVEELLAQDRLTETEVAYFKRGRNAHSKTTAKNTDVLTYRYSTGFEAMIGYLHLTGQADRLAVLIQFCIDHILSSEQKKA